jgi:phenylacetic acid degradation operon negative regulatory protein
MTVRPQDLVFTLYGEFLLKRGAVWVGSLIELLAPLGLNAGGVRTVLSRMTAKGWLAAERSGRRGYYALSARGRRLLEEGEARIYRPPQTGEWDGEWTLLAYSVPEELRPLRDRLRTRLSWLGFGSLGNGLWVCPHDVGERVREVAEELGLGRHLELFRARHGGFSTREQLVRQCWDLPALNVRYEAFIARHLPVYRRLRDHDVAAIMPLEAYVRRFELVHEYREFPLLDPYLPRALHPSDWAGECAQALFHANHTLLAGPADAHLETLVEVLPASRAAPRGERMG